MVPPATAGCAEAKPTASLVVNASPGDGCTLHEPRQALRGRRPRPPPRTAPARPGGGGDAMRASLAAAGPLGEEVTTSRAGPAPAGTPAHDEALRQREQDRDAAEHAVARD